MWESVPSAVEKGRDAASMTAPYKPYTSARAGPGEKRPWNVSTELKTLSQMDVSLFECPTQGISQLSTARSIVEGSAAAPYACFHPRWDRRKHSGGTATQLVHCLTIKVSNLKGRSLAISSLP